MTTTATLRDAVDTYEDSLRQMRQLNHNAGIDFSRLLSGIMPPRNKDWSQSTALNLMLQALVYESFMRESNAALRAIIES